MNFAPTIRQLEYLVALHRTQHFSKAADDCHVSQSTLSAGLKEMEKLMGVTLVERSRKQVLFTEVGELTVARAKDILFQVDNLMDEVAVARDPFAGHCRFGIIPTIAPYLLGRIMPALRTAFPAMQFDLVEDKSGILCSSLRNGDLDLILYALPFACDGVDEFPLFEDEFKAVWAGNNCPVADEVTLEDLEEQEVLLLEEGHCLKDHALSACKLVGQANVSASGTSLPTIVEMVAGGAGMTLLPAIAIDAGLTDRSGLCVRPFRDPAPSRTIGLVWRQNSPRGETFRAIGHEIRQAL